MKLTERQGKIIEILKAQGYAKVDFLSKKTFISPSSIRRDLQYLENMGLVERDYGGVRLKGVEKKHPPIQVRKNKDKMQKKIIAKKACGLVKNGYTVILDSSTTCYYLVDELAELKNITVITNNLETAIYCIQRGLAVYAVGGRALRRIPVVAGAYAEDMLKNVWADIAFFSSYGIDENGIVSDPSEEENQMRRLMMSRAKEKVLLLDGSKIGRSSVHVLCTVGDVDHFITNDDDIAKRYLLLAN